MSCQRVCIYEVPPGGAAPPAGANGCCVGAMVEVSNVDGTEVEAIVEEDIDDDAEQMPLQPGL